MKAQVSNDGQADTNDEPDCHRQMSLFHEFRMKDANLKKTADELARLEKEVEKLRLEKNWCFDEEGKRVIPTAEEQAIKICEQIVNDHDLVKDVVKALRMKKLDLQINIKRLNEECEMRKEEIG